MKSYLSHLLADLRQAAGNLPVVYPYHIDSTLPEKLDWVPELAHTPFKSIAEWTGIPVEALPPHDMLTEEEVAVLVPAMEALWEAFHFEFNVNGPMCPDLKYLMMYDCWEDLVQYLPQSGCDVELCAGDFRKCRMGKDCFCLHDPPDLSAEVARADMQ